MVFNKKRAFFILAIIFIIAGLASILIFTSLDKAKWFDDWLDIVSGLVLLYFGVWLYSEYLKLKNTGVLYIGVAVFIAAFGKLAEIALQEWQVSIQYAYPFFQGTNLGTALWLAPEVVMTFSIVIVFITFLRIKCNTH